MSQTADLELASYTNANQDTNGPDKHPHTEQSLPATYELPPVVKSRVDGNYQLANAVAIVSTLFAAVMIGMGQIITPTPDFSAGWEAVLALTYSSAIANLASATCALWVMAMCSDLPQKAQSLIVDEPASLPARVYHHQERLTKATIQDDYALLKAFGMYEAYPWMEYGEIGWLIVGLVLMFSAITTWSWVVQSNTVAGVILIFVAPALLSALYPIWFTIRETYREHRTPR